MENTSNISQPEPKGDLFLKNASSDMRDHPWSRIKSGLFSLEEAEKRSQNFPGYKYRLIIEGEVYELVSITVTKFETEVKKL